MRFPRSHDFNAKNQQYATEFQNFGISMIFL